MNGRSGFRSICAAAGVLCLHANEVLAQPPAPTILERATDPLRHAAGTPPSDHCLYWPCPGPQLFLNRLTGSVIPKRTWMAGDRIRLAVVNLNPFIHRTQVVVETKPLDPEAPGDFALQEAALDQLTSTRADAPPPLFAPSPCDISEAQRQRLRLASGRVREARRRMGVWLQDSLAGPRDAVENRMWELSRVLRDEYAPARELFDAAWRYRELADVYAPAVLRSGLADSTRIVPLALVIRDLANEVAEFTNCVDDELVTWKTEVALTTDMLAQARSYVSSTANFAEELLSQARTYWTTASRPRSFYVVRDVGGYDAPMNVFVRLYLLALDESVPQSSQLSERQADMGWTLIFRE